MISPIAETGKLVHMDGISQEESAAAFKRLVESGEIERFDSPGKRGFLVKRFDSLVSDMQDMGRRAYFRKARKARVGA